jgi:hypothetical protein
MLHQSSTPHSKLRFNDVSACLQRFVNIKKRVVLISSRFKENKQVNSFFLAALFAVALLGTALGQNDGVSTPDRSVPLIPQKDLKGSVSDIKLFLNQPLSVWIKQYGEGVVLNEATRKWMFGRWELVAAVNGENKLADFVFLVASLG